MARIVVVKNQSGAIIDTTGQNIGPLVDTNAQIHVRVTPDNEISQVDSHITLVPDTHIVADDSVEGSGDVDGGSF